MAAPEDDKAVRIDKWLWAARFYKTRSIARQMIEGGKVDYNGSRAKPSRIVEIGAKIRLLQGNVRREVEVLGLSTVRGPAKEAVLLYRETEESIKNRERLAQMKEMEKLLALAPRPDTRPNKKERRALIKLKQDNSF
ncbi:MAG: ribosome-associated heat shock protein Hsp15 [Proteobacteria bacterium]|uniref:Heat shock protein 15 n=1 Tax=Candidatus Avisuccinivibrio stercorigallinarum TaxID=2840704 RepID=A0A9D9GSZ2_9GAMM|nr:ribosome-associated heat shock protein Hsp15 [Candidatus Avisuccinivibrio stercorigallinarum]